MAVISAPKKPSARTLAIAIAVLAFATIALLAYTELYPPKAPWSFDEVRSHFPPEVQMAMGLEPFRKTVWVCHSGICLIGDPHITDGWTHEHYLRYADRDIHGPCVSEYRKFVSNIGWLEGNAYWAEFMNICKFMLARQTAAHLELYLPRALSTDCAHKIASGWIVADDGRFYHPLQPGLSADGIRMSPGSFVVECLPDPYREYDRYAGNLGNVVRRELEAYLGYSYTLMSENPERYKPATHFPPLYSTISPQRRISLIVPTRIPPRDCLARLTAPRHAQEGDCAHQKTPPACKCPRARA
ncbi:MAG: hypothetical protein OXU86_01075 [Thaumarchaeota archaeon]|nr:hypothetical protein [Nitrososphaerota archaeon]MDD9825363.1 hypothetical protein [Nitrososphaerota archaeon]